MDENRNLSVRADTAQSALTTQMDFPDSQWMMDSKYGNINLSLSTNTNCCGLFNNDLDLFSEVLDYGSTTEKVPLEVEMQCDVEEQHFDQLSSSSRDNWSVDHSYSSTAAISPTENYNVSSSTDSNFDLATSSAFEECSSTVPDVDLFSMLLDDHEVPLEDILEEMENAALKQTQCADVVRLDHDYTKKKSDAECDLPCSSAQAKAEPDVLPVTPSFAKKKKFAEMERRSRNNEASRRSRAIRKDKFKRMETEVQRLAADNQRMRVLLRDMESVARRCKEKLVSSLGKKG